MNKAALIDAIASHADLTKSDTGKALDAFIAVVENELAKGSEVTLVGFGSFSVRGVDERKCRNPQTGEEIVISAKKKPVFKPGKNLKDAANGK